MTPAANALRGEVVVTLAGQPRQLCLTLGALAQIESAFGLDGFAALSERMAMLSARDLITVLSALLMGGGEDVDLASTPLDFREAAQAVAAAFTAASA